MHGSAPTSAPSARHVWTRCSRTSARTVGEASSPDPCAPLDHGAPPPGSRAIRPAPDESIRATRDPRSTSSSRRSRRSLRWSADGYAVGDVVNRGERPDRSPSPSSSVRDDRPGWRGAVELAQQENDLLRALDPAALAHELERKVGVNALRDRDFVRRLVDDPSNPPDPRSRWMFGSNRHGNRSFPIQPRLQTIGQSPRLISSRRDS